MRNNKPTNVRKRERRDKLFKQQKGLCYYCKGMMKKHNVGDKVMPMTCTIEHLDDKFSPERGMHQGEERTVAACSKCNTDRAKERNKLFS